ncbi:ShlB/FhaC/HecB family hemolysin secretion/activation protein [Pseudomonas protegens]|uniref:ShlB/FhaC/HecB family hemolysin secretion/activation protein n=1 Tax=Pseudomonas protegens TaxID=380021 RepID=UPI0015762A15|nr:ShlB/FhaC/HecB family hemolysin secretion/activation protein [Pseudomonas protegens]NTZ69872.1 ShlB/FhaC/HecB family hemolysin secretion/activation protein [Pseudomonas protegens]
MSRWKGPWPLRGLIALVLLAPLEQGLGAPALGSLGNGSRHQDQQLEALQAQALKPVDMLAEQAPVAGSSLRLPAESPCVLIRSVQWQGAEAFAWMTATSPIIGQCVGGNGLGLLRHWLAEQLILRGYLTTQVAIPAQDLAGGRLLIQVIAGRIGTIEQQPQGIGWARPLFPAGQGQLLNVRDLDQALENLRRLPGQALSAFDLIPGTALGSTDIVIRQPEEVRRVMGMLTLDNAGIDATGRNQLGAILAIDSPLALYDQLLLTASSDSAFADHSLGSWSRSLAWNLPLGYTALSLGASEWGSRQQLFKDADQRLGFISRTRRLDAGLSLVTYRSAHSRGTLQGRLVRRQDRAWVGNTELGQLYRDITGYELSMAHREKCNASTLDFELGLRGSLPGMSAAPGAVYEEQYWNGRYRIFTGKAAVAGALGVGASVLGYQSGLFVQYAPVPVPPTEYLQIGGRYTVRGFDGNSTLASPGGWTWRNELAVAAGWGSQFYTALDAGQVVPSASLRSGERTLIGSAVGLRGSFSALSYDIALGLPLKKPDDLNSRTPTLDFSLRSRF